MVLAEITMRQESTGYAHELLLSVNAFSEAALSTFGLCGDVVCGGILDVSGILDDGDSAGSIINKCGDRSVVLGGESTTKSLGSVLHPIAIEKREKKNPSFLNMVLGQRKPSTPDVTQSQSLETRTRRTTTKNNSNSKKKKKKKKRIQNRIRTACIDNISMYYGIDWTKSKHANIVQILGDC
jgi:hypothetical protein